MRRCVDVCKKCGMMVIGGDGFVYPIWAGIKKARPPDDVFALDGWEGSLGLAGMDSTNTVGMWLVRRLM